VGITEPKSHRSFAVRLPRRRDLFRREGPVLAQKIGPDIDRASLDVFRDLIGCDQASIQERAVILR
jgi:hypothetical protein